MFSDRVFYFILFSTLNFYLFIITTNTYVYVTQVSEGGLDRVSESKVEECSGEVTFMSVVSGQCWEISVGKV